MCVGGALVYVKAIAVDALQLQWLKAWRAETLIRTWQILAKLLATAILHLTFIYIAAALVVGTEDESLGASAGAGVGTKTQLLAAIIVDSTGIRGNTCILLWLLERHASWTETLVSSSRVEAVM